MAGTKRNNKKAIAVFSFTAQDDYHVAREMMPELIKGWKARGYEVKTMQGSIGPEVYRAFPPDRPGRAEFFWTGDPEPEAN